MNDSPSILRHADHPGIARWLGHAMIAAFIRAGMPPALGAALDALCDAILSDRGDAMLEPAIAALESAAAESGSETLCLRALSRLGLLYDLAGLRARANAIAADGNTLEISRMRSIAEALQALRLPVFEAVMTSHPTSVNALDGVRALRRVGLALDAWRDGALDGEAAFAGAMDRLATAPVLPETTGADAACLPGKLSVHDETRFVLRTMGNVYRDLPQVYGAFETALEALAKQTGEAFDPLALSLRIRFSSWGSSGDKDGNANVNADTTLEAIALHRDTAYALYSADLAALQASLGETEACADWLRRMQRSRRMLHAHIARISDARAAGRMLEAAEFDRAVIDIAATGLDVGALRDDLAAIHCRAAIEPVRRRALDLWRNLSHFQDRLARIEYRETAQEYSRVVAAILSEAARTGDPAFRHLDRSYLDLPEPERVRVLSEILEAREAATLCLAAWPAIAAAGHGRPYDADDPMPIAYQTLRRMDLARDFPATVTANVLAECSRVSHILEAQFLQEASERDGARALMGIIPLFEAPEVMDAVGDILRGAYTHPAYQRHLSQVAAKIKSLGLSEGQKTQQVQFAHSDNTRRAGLPAARARIYRGHAVAQALAREFGIVTEEFHGNGQSDALRGGVRSISATTNMFNSHRFMKFTYQGGDLINYFNDPKSTLRLYTRNLSHAAFVLREAEGRDGMPDYDASHGKNVASYNAVAVDALSATWADYRDHVFTQPEIGFFLARTHDGHGNISSRASARGKAVLTRDGQPYIDATTARTITFSEAFQHAGIVPTFLGSRTLEECLRAALAGEARQQGAVEEAGHLIARLALGEIETAHASHDSLRIPATPGAPLHPDLFRHVYYKSAVFRDVIDRLAFGLAMTDLDTLAADAPSLANDAFVETRITPEYRIAARLVMLSMPPAFDADAPDPATASFTALRDHVRHLLPHLEEAMRHKTRYMHAVQSLKHRWQGLDAARHGWILSLAHACVNTVTYGRFLAADDPKYAALLHASRQSPLPFGVMIGE